MLTRIWLIVVVVAAFGNGLMAQQDLKDRAKPYGENELLGKVLAAYEGVQTYRAAWSGPFGVAEGVGGAPATEIRTAFARQGFKASFEFLTPDWQGSGEGFAFLVMYDGAMHHQAFIGADGQPDPRGGSRPVPGEMDYRSFRSGAIPPFIYPFDLPLLWSPSPLEEIGQNRIAKIETLAPLGGDARARPGLRVTYDDGGEGIVTEMWVDPGTTLVDEIAMSVGDAGAVYRFVVKERVVNEALAPEVFDHDAQVSAIGERIRTAMSGKVIQDKD